MYTCFYAVYRNVRRICQVKRRESLVRRNKRRSFVFTAILTKSFHWNSVFSKLGTECSSFSEKGLPARPEMRFQDELTPSSICDSGKLQRQKSTG